MHRAVISANATTTTNDTISMQAAVCANSQAAVDRNLAGATLKPNGSGASNARTTLHGRGMRKAIEIRTHMFTP